jgi:hypothetical protein
MNDILDKIASIKIALDSYRSLPEQVVKQLKDYYRIDMS